MKVEENPLTHLVVQTNCKLFLLRQLGAITLVLEQGCTYQLFVYFTWLLEITYKFT